jgi:glyoxylate reductase
MLGRRIHGKRIGIVGMGRIGTAVARRAKAFGLSIHYHNRKPRQTATTEDELEATYWESLDQMLARVDIVSVNCPSTPATFICSRPGGWRCCSRPPISSTPRAATSSMRRR